jgi:hypothetical protein
VLVASLGCSTPRASQAPTPTPAPTPPPAATTPSPAPTTPAPPPRFAPADGGATVHDSVRNISWLADANLAASETFGVRGINPSGSMDYPTALRFIAAMNAHDGGKGYLGHTDWALPATPPEDPGCGSHNRYAFGFGCTLSPLASLYGDALGLTWPATAVAIPSTEVKGFSNFQPYLYWSASLNANHSDTNENGFTTFSFNNGFQGSNVAKNHIYVLPMVPGKVAAAKATGTIYDPIAKVTWLANANLAATETFGVAGIAPDGSMRHDVAELWIAAMNQADGGKGYLGIKRWQLPPTIKTDPSCSKKDNFGFGCAGSPLGSLYYKLLGLPKGTPVVAAPDDPVGPLRNLEPYLYWACHGAETGDGCHPDPDLPSHVFAWSFSFGNGFQGTTMYANELYVLPYHPG